MSSSSYTYGEHKNNCSPAAMREFKIHKHQDIEKRISQRGKSIRGGCVCANDCWGEMFEISEGVRGIGYIRMGQNIAIKSQIN